MLKDLGPIDLNTEGSIFNQYPEKGNEIKLKTDFLSSINNYIKDRSNTTTAASTRDTCSRARDTGGVNSFSRMVPITRVTGKMMCNIVGEKKSKILFADF